jgi:antitoxin VapB
MMRAIDEATRKRQAVREAADGAPVVASTQATTRWLLCGRGRPVDVGSVDYTVVLRGDDAFVLFMDIEASRVDAEERFAELGYEHVPFPWYDGPDETIRSLLGDAAARTDAELEERIAPHRRNLAAEELARYRSACADTAAAFAETLDVLAPTDTELEAAGELARAARARDLVARVNLVAGEMRQPVHRHPLPTGERLGRHALLALTVERDGLHVSMTRILAFDEPPAELVRIQQATAEVDAAVLAASRPGVTHAALLEVLARAYEAQGHPEEWRRLHQGGLTGYKGREVFATPGAAIPLPERGAVAWNPSITGGGKSEDTVLVGPDGIEVATRTPELGELETSAGIPRPAIVVRPA